MKAFLSPVYLQTNAASGEKITAGLIIVTPDKIWFQFSFSKLKLLKKLHSVDAYYTAYNSFNSIDNKVIQSNYELESGKTKLFKAELPFSNEYFSYLSKYSSGLVQFATPNPINAIINEVTFGDYYKIFVGESLKKDKSSKSLFNQSFKKQLCKQGLADKADINLKLSPSAIHGLIKETDISLITKNGSVQAFQGVDFTLSPRTIIESLYEFEVVVNSLKKLSHHLKIKPGKYSIVTEEPAITSEQHKLFEQVHDFKSDDYSLIDPYQFDMVTDNIIQHNYSKFSEFLSTHGQ